MCAPVRHKLHYQRANTQVRPYNISNKWSKIDFREYTHGLLDFFI